MPKYGWSAASTNDTPNDVPSSDLTTQRDEDELVARIRAGDIVAFEALFLETMPRLCNFVFHYLHSRDEALDVVHDVFARLWYTRSSLRLTGSLTAYLYTASRNLALNRLRHTNVATAWITDTLRTPDAASSVPPDELLEAAERRAGIARAIAELPERQRTVCLLRWTHGLSYAQIAQQLGISEKTVDAQLQRAIRTIRAKVTGL